ncbi:MAG: patatin-like phospholipase family protein, partial [Thermoanaerobaculia bacterium]
ELDYTPRLRFDAVIKQEYAEIEERRRVAHGDKSPNDRPRRLVGLALSGGGVRSATFNLGMLQALAAAGKLKSFDYLSTVSGGGYVGGWWSAWLSRKQRDNEPGAVFPPAEDIESERDDRRAQMEEEGSRRNTDRPQIRDSAISAAEDPIHHLRLFSNVMTPRKGLLSADTWRAIAIVGRNICLTWMILLPMLLAAIMIGQSWFTLPFDNPDDIELLDRLILAVVVPGLLFLGSCVAVFFWMLFSRRWDTLADKLAVMLSTLAFFALTVLTQLVLRFTIPVPVKIATVVWFLFVVVRIAWLKFQYKVKWSDGDFWRNRFVALQTKTLSYSVFTLVIFLFAGFGSKLFQLLLIETQHKVAQAGGWGAFALAAISAIYTALKAAPTGGGDNTKPAGKPPLLQRLAFAIAPVLLLLVLGIVLSWIGDQLYREVYEYHTRDNHRLISFITSGALVSGLLFLIFALYEFRPPQRWKSLAVIVVWLIVGAVACNIDLPTFQNHLIKIGGVTLSLLAAALVLRAILRRLMWIFLYAMGTAATAAWFFTLKAGDYILNDERVPVFVIAGIVATLVLLVFELVQGRGANVRSVALTVIACTIFVLVGAAAGAGDNYGWRALTLVGLISTILGWVLALGWLADPNSLTMHGFYQARLVRAYMGASNERRARAAQADITDAVPGDDILLTKLRNTDRGAPYH